jgi:hypothetical protein
MKLMKQIWESFLAIILIAGVPVIALFSVGFVLTYLAESFMPDNPPGIVAIPCSLVGMLALLGCPLLAFLWAVRRRRGNPKWRITVEIMLGVIAGGLYFVTWVAFAGMSAVQ